MRRVHLHGTFADYHPGPIEIAAETAWEAIEAVTRQVKGFAPTPQGGRQVIQALGFSTLESLRNASDQTDIHLFPALSFGKNGGMIKSIIGVTLIVIGLFMGGQVWNVVVINLGVALLSGGVMEMLAKQPRLTTNNATEVRSRYLAGSSNTVKIGTTIPLLYGRHRVGGHILSLNIDAKDIGL